MSEKNGEKSDATSAVPTAQQWEYQTIGVAGDVVSGLNDFGAHRWEVCACLPPMGDGRLVFLVKRPKSLIEIAPKGLVLGRGVQ